METGALISKLKSGAPGAFLHKSRFGRSEDFSLWIDLQRIREVAATLGVADESGPAVFDWLENISVAQVEDALVITYFLGSMSKKNQGAIIRGSVHIGEAKEGWVNVPSVADVWPVASAMEREAAELFGIHFTSVEGVSHPTTRVVLPDEWHGFPLRKNYVFPREVFGIQHVRNRVSEMNDDE